MNDSDQVRAYVREHYILPARRSGSVIVKVRAGDVHKAMKWEMKKVPQVCSALSTQKFLDSAHVELIKKTGPPSGQSTTVEFTYRLLDAPAGEIHSPQKPKPAASGSGLRALYGIFAEEYRALGGGDAYLEQERSSWGLDPWEKLAQERGAKPEKGE